MAKKHDLIAIEEKIGMPIGEFLRDMHWEKDTKDKRND